MIVIYPNKQIIKLASSVVIHHVGRHMTVLTPKSLSPRFTVRTRWLGVPAGQSRNVLKPTPRQGESNHVIILDNAVGSES